MTNIKVENLDFTFDQTVEAQAYDKWRHHIDVRQNLAGGQKAVDIVAVSNSLVPATAWLIEAKDFRVVDTKKPPRSSNVVGLAQTVTDKAQHTLAGLADASVNATKRSERNYSTKALSATSTRIVLHLEPHVGPHTALFPVNFDAYVLQQLKILVRAIDRNPLVLNIENTSKYGVPWTVA